MNFGRRYEPKEGDTIEDMLLYFEMQRLKYLKVLAFIHEVDKAPFVYNRIDIEFAKLQDKAKELLKELDSD